MFRYARPVLATLAIVLWCAVAWRPLALSSGTLTPAEFFADHSQPQLVESTLQQHVDHGLIRGSQGYGYAMVSRQRPTTKPFALLAHAEEESVDAGAMVASAESILGAPAAWVKPLGTDGWVAADAQGDLRFYVENDLGKTTVMGFGGPILMGVLFDETGRILKVIHRRSLETETYLDRVLGGSFLRQWAGYPVFDSEAAIDGVSGATVTCQAMLGTTNRIVQENAPLMAPFLDRTGSTPSAFAFAYRWDSWLWAGLSAGVLLLAVSSWSKRRPRRKRVIQVSAVLLWGVWLNCSFTWFNVAQPFMGGVLGAWMIGWVALVLVGAVWGNNVYCQTLCPYGLVQKWSRFSRFGKRPLPFKQSILARIRWAVALGVVGAVLVGIGFQDFEPFPYLFRPDCSWGFLMAVAFIAISIRYPILWCRALCPTGALLDGLRSLTRVKKRAASRRQTPCVGCSKGNCAFSV